MFLELLVEIFISILRTARVLAQTIMDLNDHLYPNPNPLDVPDDEPQDDWTDIETGTEGEHGSSENEKSDDEEKDKAEANDNEPGCKHYKRKCQLVCPLESCGKVYTCRLCHDEAEISHKLDRFSVKEIICLECNTRQASSATCLKCLVTFAEYFCEKCNLFMAINPEHPPYHCDECQICRIGPREHFFHCPVCNICLPVGVQGGHKCIENSSRNNCAVCLEDIHSARTSAHMPKCGHLIHLTCYRQMIKNALYTCPTCNESMMEMKEVWKYLDDEIAISPPLPKEYRNKEVTILCRDCHKFTNVLFHFVGLKCGNCGGYNTTLEKGIDFHNLNEPTPVVAEPAEPNGPMDGQDGAAQ